MAFLASVPAIIGVVSGLASAGAGIYAAKQSRNAGIAQSNEIKQQARVEGNAAKSDEINRRRNLMRALASQSAGAGAMGIQAGGSYGNLMARDIEENENDLLTADANNSLRQRALAARSSNSRRVGNANSTSTLLDTAGRFGQSMAA